MKNKSSLRYFWVTLLNIIITIAEFIGGAVSGSLALLSDAVHNLSDVGSIILAFVANLIAKRKRNNSKTFGYDRAEILAAFTNGIILIVISIYLFIEGIQRFSHPEPIKGKIMLIVSLIGLAANLISMLVVMKEAKTSLNAKATFLNMLSDAITSVAVVIGAIVISIWKIYWVDPVLTIAASVFLLKEAYAKHVWITSPTTLMSTLTTLAMIIKNMERDKYAKIIHEELNKLSVEFARYKERWERLARNINTVSKSVEELNTTSDKITKRFDSINRVEVEKLKNEEQDLLVHE